MKYKYQKEKKEMKLIDYNNRYVILLDVNDNKYKGMAYYTDADTEEAVEDIITIHTEDNGYLEYLCF